jgi:ABC-type multidrug transport system fused ATPase/permease subunit
VNKRETAVRIVHKPTNLSVHVSSERSQQANREKALELLAAKLLPRKRRSEKAAKGRSIAKTTANEWGSQIRSYVLHPYKMVKDHRTGHESGNPDKVLAGDLDDFIDASPAGWGTIERRMIYFDKVTKQYGTRTALEGVTLSIAPKEFVSIVGHSGAGKTTLLKLLLAEERRPRVGLF